MGALRQEDKAKLDKLSIKFEEWRAQRETRKAIPDELWAEAVELARQIPKTHVVKALRLNAMALNKKMDSASSIGPSPLVDPTQGFIRTNINDLNLRAKSSGQEDTWRLVLERTDGTQLKMSVPGKDRNHLMALVARFLG